MSRSPERPTNEAPNIARTTPTVAAYPVVSRESPLTSPHSTPNHVHPGESEGPAPLWAVRRTRATSLGCPRCRASVRGRHCAPRDTGRYAVWLLR